MDGAKIRELREQYGLKRPQLCEMTDGALTVAKLAGIELGRDPRPNELEALQLAFERLAEGKPETTARIEKKSPYSDDIIDPKLEDTSEPSDPLKWTSANPSYGAKLEDLARSLTGRKKYKYNVVNTRFRRTNEWNGIKAGDPVNVVRESGSFFEFIAHVTDTEKGDEWVDVRGGKPGHVMMRSFTCDRIKPRAKPRKRRKAG